MNTASAILLEALRRTPRPYRMPDLPVDAAAAAGMGTDVALAFAIERKRLETVQGTAAGDDARELFVRSLADLVQAGMREEGGDPAFQALLLRALQPDVHAYVALSARAAADQRLVRASADALAHPGKLQGMPQGPQRDALARLHAAVSASAWDQAMAAAAGGGVPLPPAALDALERLLRTQALLASTHVARYRSLVAKLGPLAGSGEAAQHGRAAARVGAAAEAQTLEAFTRMATLLDAADPSASHLAVASLRTPPGFPGESARAKDEWDAAILRTGAGEDAAQVLLLAEVKASPAAATSDYARLLRGLERLALAGPRERHEFASAQGKLRIAGASLRALAPAGRRLPAQVVYCTAAEEAAPAMLGAASKAVLLGQAACVAFAAALADGAQPAPDDLAGVWEGLGREPQLRAVLHQFETATLAREAMVRPLDLAYALAASAAPVGRVAR